ncbi:hypothetical protein PGT21_009947 [Puccinia graminis f. sp. tritici]|uniref:Uncharacterized protein n=1 Tax=Puccinia graminis f. sp. tritici TaxID=56615 RepID=A0A5B0QSW1_PUCGR|nr:hypothetical protein PGT21_009947 [Puccinia graminis f. sp. tritici]
MPAQQLYQVAGFQLNAHRTLRKGVFILIRQGEENAHHTVGCIDHMWEARRRSQLSHWVCYTEYKRGGVDDFYGMRKISKTGITKFVKIDDVVSTINVQHNCHAGGCEVVSTGRVIVEREESEENNKTVTHKNTVHYLVNSLEIPGANLLRHWVDLPRREEDVSDLIPMLQQGLAVWLNKLKATALGLRGVWQAASELITRLHEDDFKATHPVALRTSSCIHNGVFTEHLVGLFGNTVLMTWRRPRCVILGSTCVGAVYSGVCAVLLSVRRASAVTAQGLPSDARPGSIYVQL